MAKGRKQDSPGLGGETHLYNKEGSAQSTPHNSDMSPPGEVSHPSVKNYYLPRGFYKGLFPIQVCKSN